MRTFLPSMSMIKMPCSFPPGHVLSAESALRSQSSPALPSSDPFFFFFQQAREFVRPSVISFIFSLLFVFEALWYSTESSIVVVP